MGPILDSLRPDLFVIISQTHFFATKKTKMWVFKLLLLSFSFVVPILGNNPKAFLEWFNNHKEGSVFPVPEVDCDWTLPDAGLVKKSYVVVCPAHCLNVNHCVRVKGSGPYAVNSPVCMAAIHAGVIQAQTGGAVDVRVVDGKKAYAGSTKIGVAATAYAQFFASFVLEKSDVSCEKKDKKPTPEPCYETALIDIVFLADSSLSVHSDNFNLEKKFVSDLVSHFPIGPKQTRVGLVTFNDTPKTRFGLEKYKTTGALLNAIFNVQYEKGGTYVGKALWEVVKTMKFRPNPAVHKIVVVFTDGRSYDSVKRPLKKLKAKGVKMISFGVANIHQSNMLEIADGKKENVFSAKSYKELKNFVGSLMTKICSLINPTAQ